MIAPPCSAQESALGEEGRKESATEDSPTEAGAPGADESEVSESGRPNETELSEARALFEAGQAAFENGRPVDAQEFFRRSLLITPHPSTAFNLVITLRATNDIIDALEVLQQLLVGHYGELADAERREAENIHRDLMSRRSILHLRSNHGGPVEVTVDGRNAGRIEPGGQLDYSTNPGTFTVSGRAGEGETVLETVRLSAGEALDLILSFEVDSSDGRRPAWRRAWFWLLTVGIPVAALATGLGLWAGLRDSEGTDWEPVAALIFNPRW